MAVDPDLVLEQALDLSPMDRAELVEKLLESFEFPSRNDIDVAWAKEVEDRIETYDRGEIKSVPAREVFNEINRQRR